MPVVNGIEAFKRAMAGHEDEYVLIGGGACSILFDREDGTFRVTKSLCIMMLIDESAGLCACFAAPYYEW